MHRLLPRVAIVCAVALAAIPAVAMAAPPVSPVAATKMQVTLPVALNRFVVDPANSSAAATVANAGSRDAASDAARNGRATDGGNVAPDAAGNAAKPAGNVNVKPANAISGTDGYDISWPQCNDKEPASPFNFAIIGVTGGKAMTTNDCFNRQWEWANSGNVQAQVYINVNGLPLSYVDWGCPAGDRNCFAYGFGRATADQAVAYARTHGADPKMWWLDVEQMNYWSPDKLQNAFVIRGAMEGLQAAGKDVGVYSTPYQWNEIAGQYAPRLPVWTAGADDRTDAQGRCTEKYAFGGGQVKLVQYIFANFDTNWAC